MSEFDLKQLIESADKILIGLGEDFDQIGNGNEDAINFALAGLSDTHNESLAPYVYDAFRRRSGVDCSSPLLHLVDWIKDKDYYVLTTSTNIELAKLPWKQGRFVSPCISYDMLQCPNGCGESPIQMTSENIRSLTEFGDRCCETSDELQIPNLGNCPVCGEKLYPNNIYAPHYDERGYLDKWGKYTGWLPFTLRTNILIIELGVGMNFPGIIRMPFEKTAALNQKAVFVRVNDTFPYLPAGLEGRSYIVKNNAIDWLNGMC